MAYCVTPGGSVYWSVPPLSVATVQPENVPLDVAMTLGIGAPFAFENVAEIVVPAGGGFPPPPLPPVPPPPPPPQPATIQRSSVKASRRRRIRLARSDLRLQLQDADDAVMHLDVNRAGTASVDGSVERLVRTVRAAFERCRREIRKDGAVVRMQMHVRFRVLVDVQFDVAVPDAERQRARPIRARKDDAHVAGSDRCAAVLRNQHRDAAAIRVRVDDPFEIADVNVAMLRADIYRPAFGSAKQKIDARPRGARRDEQRRLLDTDAPRRSVCGNGVFIRGLSSLGRVRVDVAVDIAGDDCRTGWKDAGFFECRRRRGARSKQNQRKKKSRPLHGAGVRSTDSISSMRRSISRSSAGSRRIGSTSRRVLPR